MNDEIESFRDILDCARMHGQIVRIDVIEAYFQLHGDPDAVRLERDQLLKKVDELQKSNSNLCAYTESIYHRVTDSSLSAYRCGYRDGVVDCKNDWKQE